jgi:serine/threonine protein kinase/formylglycine-generating enzyme required for sulfatase activity
MRVVDHLAQCATCSKRNAELLATMGPRDSAAERPVSEPSRLPQLFIAALNMGQAVRARFVERECGQDEGLRQELISMIAAAEETVLTGDALADRRIDQQRADFDRMLDHGATQTHHTSSRQPTAPIPDHIGPFKILTKIGEGGMGTVYEAEQASPKRIVALKVIRAGLASSALLRRFALESQVLGRLQHPGIAQVYQAGTADTAAGQLPYFAMEFVRGVDVRQYVNQNNLSSRERLNLLVRLCDAVEHAHQKGVIHRDLKPGNILVDRTGQPKILDFGVARATDSDMQVTTMQTDVGQIIGTLQYMSPEQVAADPGNLDTRSDVYALGVIAYELLTGQVPYDLKNHMLHEAARIIQEEEPTSASSINPIFRGDIETIVAKALEKDKQRRYQSASGLADDIRRYLEDEPILARPPSAMYQLQKFAKRNKGLFTALSAIFVVLLAGIITSTRSAINERAAKEEVLRLADIKRLANAQTAADDLWPAHPENIEAMEQWLREKAAPLRDNLSKHEATLATLREQAIEYDLEQQSNDRKTHPLAGELAEKSHQLPKLRRQFEEATAEENPATQTKVAMLEKSISETEERIGELEDTVNNRRTWTFTDDELQWRHDTLAGLVDDLSTFVDDDPKKSTLASVDQRRAFARAVGEQSVSGADATAAWAEAIADVSALEVYDGLRLKSQVGFVPLRRDPRSGLWEFWHVQTGARPAPNPDHEATNSWILTGETGLIFVLIPGGTFHMGAQKDDPDGPNYDPEAEGDEGPVQEIALDPFLLSKYEMTQGQWLRFTGSNPSNYGPNWKWPGRFRPDGSIHENTAWNPVEQVSWDDGTTVLGRLGLVLPTEAQWEYAARAGTTSVWWTGDDKASIGTQRAGNIGDAWTRDQGGPGGWAYEDWEDYWICHSPVGTFAPNPFGLHDTIGNLLEWCRDRKEDSYKNNDPEPGSGFRSGFGARARVNRGGALTYGATLARSANRNSNLPDVRGNLLGVRPALLLRSE